MNKLTTQCVEPMVNGLYSLILPNDTELTPVKVEYIGKVCCVCTIIKDNQELIISKHDTFYLLTGKEFFTAKMFSIATDIVKNLDEPVFRELCSALYDAGFQLPEKIKL